MKTRRHKLKRKSDMDIASVVTAVMRQHVEDDQKNFGLIHESFEDMGKKLDRISGTVDSLQGAADFFKGAGLLKKPMLLIVGFILGVVALFGGIKTLLAFFIPIK